MDSSANARLEILYRQCYPSLYRYALWALRDHHQAEEAVQETFLSALPKAAEVTALDRPEGWLMQTVKHKVLHLRREQDRRWAVRCWQRCCSPPSSPFLRRARNACSQRG